jgi:hypothetical protein
LTANVSCATRKDLASPASALNSATASCLPFSSCYQLSFSTNDENQKAARKFTWEKPLLGLMLQP